MATKKSSTDKAEISILEVKRGTMECCILGLTPLVCEAMSGKVIQGLLLPPGRKTAASKASTLKHNPMEEYVGSVYRASGEKTPTRVLFPATGFKKALADVAKDIPGANKAQIGRLSYVEGSYIPIYGIPQLMMSVVRNSDIARTPDVRTRAVLPRWACSIRVTYIKPLLRDAVVANLLAAAGMMRGIGGWRTEKGAGDYGQFQLVAPEDPEFVDIVNTGGREAQDLALAEPEFFDDESAKLMAWFNEEITRRGFEAAG